MLVVIVLTALIYGGYYFGRKASNEYETPLEIVFTASPSAIPQILSTVLGGVSKSAGLSFDQYSITTPKNGLQKRKSNHCR